MKTGIVILLLSLFFTFVNQSAAQIFSRQKTKDLKTTSNQTFLQNVHYSLPPDSVFSLTGRMADGPTYVVTADRNCIYMNSGGYLKIIDYSDAERPREISKLLIDFIPADLQIFRNHLFIRDYLEKIVVVDIADPRNPGIVARFRVPNQPLFDWSFNENRLFVAAGKSIVVVDISNPGSPEKISDYSFIAPEYINALAVRDNNLLFYSFEKLFLLDISEISKPEFLDEIEAPAYANSIEYFENYAILNTAEAIYFIDLSHRSNPSGISRFYINGPTSETRSQLSGDLLYVMCQGHQIDVINISDPLSPQHIYQSKQAVYDFALNDSLLILSLSNKIEISELSKTGEISRKGTYSSGCRVKDYLFFDDFIYRTCDSGRIEILDISNQLDPYPVGQISVDGSPGPVEIWEQHLYLILNDSLQVYTLINPIKPEPVARIRLDFSPWDMAVSQGYIYLSHYRQGLTVYDISDPYYPEEAAHFPEIQLGKIQVYGQSLYGENISTFRIFNITEPLNPVLTGHYQPEWYINDFSVNGQYAALCIDGYGFSLLDLTEPNTPVSVGGFSGNFEACEIQQDHLFTFPELNIFDISDPKNIEYLSQYRFDDYLGGNGKILLKENKIFVNEENLGLYIFENKLVRKVVIDNSFSDNFPNPFNGNTTIRYQLRSDSHVQVDIFDIQGHHIKNLKSQYENVGEHSIDWDATNNMGQPVASGVYVYRVAAGNRIDSQKILLIR